MESGGDVKFYSPGAPVWHHRLTPYPEITLLCSPEYFLKISWIFARAKTKAPEWKALPFLTADPIRTGKHWGHILLSEFLIADPIRTGNTFNSVFYKIWPWTTKFAWEITVAVRFLLATTEYQTTSMSRKQKRWEKQANIDALPNRASENVK